MADAGRNHAVIAFAPRQIQYGLTVASVSGHQLVAAFTSQNNLDVPGSKLGNKIERDTGWMSERLVFMPDQLGQGFEKLFRADGYFVMIRLEGTRNKARVFELVRFTFGKRN